MSTKIYNGYRLKKIKTLEDALSYFKDFRPKIEKETTKLINRRCGFLASNLYDQIEHIGLHPKSEECEKFQKYLNDNQYIDNLLSPIIDDYEQSVKNASQKMTRDFDDIDFSLSLFPVNGRILVLFYSQQQTFKKLFEKLDEVEEYHYQNQTDKPSKISKELWKKRESDWELALGNNTPAEMGLSYELMSADRLWKHLPKYDDVLKNVPPEAERKARIIERIALDLNPEILTRKLEDEIHVWIESSQRWKSSPEYAQIKKDLESKIKIKQLVKEDFLKANLKPLFEKTLKKEK